MANGKWQLQFSKILEMQEANILGLTAGLSCEGRSVIIQDWTLAKETFVLGLKLRLNFYSWLPHRLMGIAASDPADAQEAVRRGGV